MSLTYYRVKHRDPECSALIGFVGALVSEKPPDLVLLEFADGRREVFRTGQLVAMDGPEEPWRSPDPKVTGMGDRQLRRTHVPYELVRLRRTHCQRNHPWNEENTIWELSKKTGTRHRLCRACKNWRRSIAGVKESR